jgi:hypothetical protein
MLVTGVSAVQDGERLPAVRRWASDLRRPRVEAALAAAIVS